jgi:phage shock protein A
MGVRWTPPPVLGILALTQGDGNLSKEFLDRRAHHQQHADDHDSHQDKDQGQHTKKT